MVLRSLLLLAVVAGCVHRPPVARLAVATPIVVVAITDDAKGACAYAAMPALASELAGRNLVVEAAPDAALASLDCMQDGRTRSESLAKALGPGKLFLLVQLRAEYFAQMEGKWKWNVDAQVIVARSDDLTHETAASQRTPVFLDSESDGAHEAFAEAGPLMSDWLGRLVDDHFAAHAGVPAPIAPAPAPAPAPSPQPTAP